ncbi:MAG: hypothetical protein WCB33_01250, partial [Bradyrhizobium sp.]
GEPRKRSPSFATGAKSREKRRVVTRHNVRLIRCRKMCPNSHNGGEIFGEVDKANPEFPAAMARAPISLAWGIVKPASFQILLGMYLAARPTKADFDATVALRLTAAEEIVTPEASF